MSFERNQKMKNQDQTKSQTIQTEINALLRARNPLIWLVTREELRGERTVIEAAGKANYPTFFWDCYSGLTDSAGNIINNNLKDSVQILDSIRTNKTRAVYVLRDLHKWLADPVTIRGLRSLARELQSTPKDEARAIVIITPSAEIPADIKGQLPIITFALPDRVEMASILKTVIDSQSPEIQKDICANGTRDQVVDSAMGLTAEEAASCFARSLVMTKKIDPLLVSNEKKQVVANQKGITWTDPDPRGLKAVGGLDGLKNWLTVRKSGFGKKARAYGLTAPRGIVLVGVPGCGKSLMAKSVAAAWQMPLLRLDMGAAKSKWVGESESLIRSALGIAETVSPCILWIDEIEKAFAGSASQTSDGGVSADALGTFLNWMQERAGSVFVVATANNVEQLPPELLRKGRFDELFFVDLPTNDERYEILITILNQYGKFNVNIDIDQVATKTMGFSGAELAALVPDAMFAAFADGEREITTDDLLEVAGQTVPLSTTSNEKINKLREWAKGRARPASMIIQTKNKNSRELDI